ncbi:23S rRNA (guanosine(2251)-2'-O)-methyltransferase RlmB [Methylosinus sp. H3A]|uniref:23S rRNA (guanosine(2251)-2'-O)-methyltransferase RlmB n=1 Tax=Methylosinus sp. H3A TaxID=2785786 RepID=UPI0018C2D37A|nr:23S rRNA (guanosine(2251)-2'-O)-methyltransferase RlmB [Methylosinus sp. H3A]MBG0811122.1 23S rRNA (guanosine(2251)-2'-O)-methyltransferase RlmB [Methylosinus sp. H3A]
MSRPPAGKDRDHQSRDGKDRGRRPPPRQTASEEAPFRRPAGDIVVLYGAHAVREALVAGRRKLLTLYATEGAAERIAPLAAAAGLTPKIVDARALSQRLGEESVHQGLMLEARPLPEADIADIEPKSGLVLVLDQVTDPHNVGAILRTAAAFAVDALVVTERHSPDFTGVLAKAASGALEHVTIVSVVNLARALEQLAARDFLIVGLDSEGPQPLEANPLRRPLALVLGAEGKGLRRLTRERCDLLARLDMPGPIKSLNVSNACAAALMALRLRLG